VGGITGYLNFNALVENCSVAGTVSGNVNVGGVVGNNYGTVQKCYAISNVNGYQYIGGVVGNNNGTVQNCYATGDISSTYNSIGGVVGYNNGTVQYCYTTSNISGNSNVGGVVGAQSPSAVTGNTIALNANVTATNSSSLYLGRIMGGNTDGTMGSNYARNDMKLTLGDNAKAPVPNINGIDGADITSTNYGLQTWWSGTAGFSFGTTDAWEWSGSLPILRNMPVGTQNPTVETFTTAFITISVEQITDINPSITIPGGGIIYRITQSPNAITFTLSNPTDYDAGSIKWTLPGVGDGQTVTGTGATFEVSANNPNYNSVGPHTITLVVRIEGAPYSKVIDFEIRN
jgi:hypothetical protein